MGQLLGRGLGHTEANLRDWCRDAPPLVIEGSLADRTVAPKKRGSLVGFIVDPFRLRQIWFESKLEQGVLAFLVANPDVVWVREQQRCDFIRSGRKCHHYFDFVVKYRDGRVIAYAVKYSQDVDADLRRDLVLAERSNGSRFADAYRIFTEKDVAKLQIEAAGHVIDCGNDFDFEGRAAVQKALRSLGSSVTLSSIAAASGLTRLRGERAAATLIQKGFVARPPGRSLKDSVLINRISDFG